MRRLAVVGVVAVAAACASSTPPDPALEGLAVTAVAPAAVVPGSTLVVTGDSFVEAEWGQTTLVLSGATFTDPAVELRLDAQFVDYQHLHATITSADLITLGASAGPATLDGDAVVEVVSTVDGQTYRSAPRSVRLTAQPELAPQVDFLEASGVIFANDELEVRGDGFLLGGGEGQTIARVAGCFQRQGQPACTPVATQEVPVVPAGPFTRDRGTIRFVPAIAGIRAGTFTGTVTLEDRPLTGRPFAAPPVDVSYDLVTAQIFQIQPAAASLGQFVDIRGGGFVGGEAGASTDVRLQGTFTPTGAPGGGPVDLVLIPEFAQGERVRYVVNTDDALGQAIDLRRVTGTFVGTITPTVRYGGDTVTGPSTAVTLAIAPVKQVVYLDFRPSYVESLRRFGLRAVDAAVRQRVLDVVRAAYPAVNIEFRTAPPDDFALFSQVEIHGPDPNGMGLFGYDNTPGKDDGNLRLYDRLGGVNAATQQDGYPGYGGVFIESLMGFSQHPAVGESLSGADPVFDRIFDPFRPDRGDIIIGADLGGGVPTVDGSACPATSRRERIGCAVWSMGSLIGTTLAHEIGHSLGLANPGGDGFHNAGDELNRLMDSGGDRPFLERAVLEGQGPAVFCTDEYQYLRQILPTTTPADTSERPPC
ncbi:MAG: hypothetical protein R3B06_31910 [Kofleriaceae bacterium]